MKEEQDRDGEDRRLRDVYVFESACERVEAAGTREKGAHQEHVAPHEEGERDSGQSADQLVAELPSRLADGGGPG